jgi:hypothetical protein
LQKYLGNRSHFQRTKEIKQDKKFIGMSSKTPSPQALAKSPGLAKVGIFKVGWVLTIGV